MDTGALEDGQINLNSWEHPSVATEKKHHRVRGVSSDTDTKGKLASLSFLGRTKSSRRVSSLIVPGLTSLLGRESVVLDQIWRELEDSTSISKG